MTQEQLKQHIHSGKFCPVYALYGEEAYLSEYYAKAIADKVCDGEMDEFNRLSFDGQDTPWDDIEQAAQALPLMAERKCVTVRNCDIASMGDKVMPLLQDPPQDTVLIFLFTAVQPSGKSAKWKSFFAAVEACGGALENKHKTEAELVRLLTKGAAKRGCALTDTNAATLVARCGEEMLVLLSELEKLCAVAGKGGTITEQLIEQAASRTLDSSVFALSKELIYGRTERALLLLSELLEQKEDPIAILAVLANAYADLYRASVAQQSGRPVAEVAKYYQYGGREFRLRNAANDVRRLSDKSVQQSLEYLAAADRRLKSSRADARVILEQTVVQLASAARGDQV